MTKWSVFALTPSFELNEKPTNEFGNQSFPLKTNTKQEIISTFTNRRN